MLKRGLIILGLILSAAALVAITYYIWPAKKYTFVPRYTDPSYYNQSKEGYVVYEPQCEIPDIKPFDESIAHFIKTFTLDNCTDKPLLTSIVRNNDSHTLILHDEYKNFYIDDPETHLQCCYSVIRRREPKLVKNDNQINYTDCRNFVKNVSFWGEEEFIFIKCNATNKANITKKEGIYKNLHAFVRKSNGTIKRTMGSQATNQKNLSAYIIGIDSVSRMYLIRSMPNTYEKLSNGWVELKGYNKIEYNTFPNMMAFITGSSIPAIRKTCMKCYDIPLDRCDYIWKSLSKRGYVTLYAEDEQQLSTFNYDKFGFKQAPTDHYMRPFFLASKDKVEKYPELPFRRCLGPEYITDHLFNYLFDFTVEYREHPKFALLWANSFSHEDVNGISALDDKYVSYFDHLEKLGVYESSLIVFLSDHGDRFGDIRLTHIGWMEERLPFIFIHFPEWWIKENPEKYKNLQSNSDKLTSPYDLYLTLKDVLEGEEKKGTPSCPKCRSLLTPIPWDRSCDDAGIPSEWCACERLIEIEKDDKVVQKGAHFIVSKLNKMLSDLSKSDIKKGFICAELQLKRIEKALINTIHSNEDDINDYTVIIETTPGDAIFEATIRHDVKRWWIFTYNEKYEVVGTVSRLNKYGNQSSCIKNQPLIRNYCFCQYQPELTQTIILTKV